MYLTELHALAALTIFGLFAWLPGSYCKAQSFGGMSWLNSNREVPKGKTLSECGGRCERAYNNLLAFYPIFAVSILLLAITSNFNQTTLYAAWIFVVARVLHYFFYAIGLCLLRTITWAVGLICNIILLVKFFS